jgi:hypothetical protein
MIATGKRSIALPLLFFCNSTAVLFAPVPDESLSL